MTMIDMSLLKHVYYPASELNSGLTKDNTGENTRAESEVSCSSFAST